MKKIPSIFERDFNGDPSLVLDHPVAECQWVFDGEGIPTRKLDGTAVLVNENGLWVRFDAKHGKQPPSGFVPCQDPDPQTGHWPGWIPPDPKQHKWHIAAYQASLPLDHGTYEACGPHFQGNPEHFASDRLVLHGAEPLHHVPLTFEGLREWFTTKDIEGIVWHHPDGRMAKVKARDFGYKRGQQCAAI